MRGDLVGIEILEQRDGRVTDELVVQLPSPDLVHLLVRELAEVDGVSVDDVISADCTPHDPQLAAFEVASVLLGAESGDELLWSLCTHIRRTVRAEWVAVVDTHDLIPAAAGPVPDDEQLAALAHAAEGVSAVDPSLFVERLPVPSADVTLLLGRPDVPFRAAERRRASVVARLAGTWWNRLAERSRTRSMLAHPALGNKHEVALPAVPDTVAEILDQRV